MNKSEITANTIDYGWRPWFIAKPAPGAIEQDLTQATLILDEKNSLGETFHWEVNPYETSEHIPTRSSSHPATKAEHAVFVKMQTIPFYAVDNEAKKA